MYNKSLLSRLCAARGISGDEAEVRTIIKDEIASYADEMITDPLGNLIVFKKGKSRPKHRVMLAAHMDEVGFLLTDITCDGYLKFAPVGGIDRRVVYGKSVKIGGKGVNGVVCVKPVHLCSADETLDVPNITDMYISIGAKDRDEALGSVAPGDCITFDVPPCFTDARIMARAIDDRAGCYLLCEMIKSELEYDMYFTFTVQEEVGLRGAKTAAYAIDPQFAVVVESTTASDLPDLPPDKQVCTLGGGAVISFMDCRTIYDKELYRLAFNIARDNNIPLQSKRAVAGGNDGGVIHTSRAGVRTLAISLPCRYIHSGISMIAAGDLESARDILPKLAEKICVL